MSDIYHILIKNTIKKKLKKTRISSGVKLPET